MTPISTNLFWGGLSGVLDGGDFACVDETPASELFILVWLVWPVAIGFKFFEMYQKKEAEANSERLAKAKVFVLKEETLVREVTVAEIEEANMVRDPLGAAPTLPFGHLNGVWVEFREGLEVGETLHLFESVGLNAFRKQLIWGYAVFKEGRVERFMTAGWRR
jgi:hypothetical protein